MDIRILKSVLAALVITVSSATASAQEKFIGTWNGVLSIQGTELTLVVHIGQTECAIDSPDQGAYGIPAELKELTDAKVHIDVPSIGASLEGNMMFGLIVGKFRQSGLEFPISLKSGDIERNRPQTPAGPFPYTSEEVTFTNPEDGAVLSGTLVCPEDFSTDTPVVLFISGSGMQNRDEELFGHKPFFVIADHLARNGIASLRYDDRSYGKSTGDASEATTETFMKDAASGIDFIRSLNRFGKTGVIGHSEGGTIAFMLAGEGKADFIISLAGASANGTDVLVEQNRKIMTGSGIPEAMTDDYCKVLKILLGEYRDGKTADENPEETVRRLISESDASFPKELTDNMAEILRTFNPWLAWFLALNPVEWIERIECPVMALNGEKDVQVIADQNLSLLKEKLPASEKHMIKAYPDLNHMFQHCSTGLTNEYVQIEETISEEVLDDITGWIKTL